jgi:Saccharopine dehydrogenase NADP binding domain
MNWVLYGAAGVTGQLIAEAAIRRGHRPTLAGRNVERLRSIAERLQLPWQVVDIHDPVALERLVGSSGLTLLVASPFHDTSRRVVDACLATGAHYLDLANEIPVLESVYARDSQARHRGVTLLPGVGFGTVAADTLVRHLVGFLPDAHRLDLTVDPYVAGSSPGARANALRVISHGSRVIRDGRMVPVRWGSIAPGAVIPEKARTVFSVPSGELSAAWRTTGIPNITVCRPSSLPPAVVSVVLPALSIIAGSQLLQGRGEGGARADFPVPDPNKRSRVWARAWHDDGRSALEAGEGYAFSAESAVSAVEAILASPAAGAYTPGALLGADFPLRIPETRRHDARFEQTPLTRLSGAAPAPFPIRRRLRLRHPPSRM